jgi:hypothetical protein
VEHLQAQYRVARGTIDLEELISWQPQAAVVLAPTSEHKDIVLRLLRGGVDVLVEKPATLHSADTLELGLRDFEDRSRKLQVSGSRMFPGEEAFYLYDTRGLPFEIIEDLAQLIYDLKCVSTSGCHGFRLRGLAGVDGAGVPIHGAVAGISIGSLYRYFPDKDAILRALASRYYEQLHALYGEVFTGDPASAPLPALIDQTARSIFCPCIRRIPSIAIFSWEQTSPPTLPPPPARWSRKSSSARRVSCAALRPAWARRAPDSSRRSAKRK